MAWIGGSAAVSTHRQSPATFFAGRTKLGVGFENSKWRPVAVAPLTAFAIAPLAAFAAAPPLALGFAATVASGLLLLLIGR